MDVKKHAFWWLNSGGGGDTNSQGQQAFLSIGHSIAQGTASGSGQPSCASGTVYGTVDGITISEITDDDVNAIRGFDPGLVGSAWPAFGNAYYASSGKKPVIILRGIGNSVFLSHASATGGDWQPGNSNYDNAKAAAIAALDTLGVSKLKGIFVNLGINDIAYNNTFANISTAIDSFIASLISDFPDTPIYFVQQGRTAATSNSLKNRQVKNKLKQIANLNTNVYIGASMTSFEGTGLYDADNLHPNVAGYTMLGQMLNRLVINPSYSKFARAIISSHHDELSASRKSAIDTFITSIGSDYFNLEDLLRYKTTIIANTMVDYTLLNHPVNVSGSLTANDYMSFTRTTAYMRTGFVPSFQIVSGQNDIIIGSRVKTNSIAAGTQAYLFGGNDGTVSTVCYQGPSSEIAANLNGRYTVWASAEGGDTKFLNDTMYWGATDGTNAYIIKDSTIVDQDTTTVTLSVLSREIYSGAHNANGSTQNGLTSQLLNFVAAKYSGVTVTSLKSALDTLDSNW